jgi:hypothetical protein
MPDQSEYPCWPKGWEETKEPFEKATQPGGVEQGDIDKWWAETRELTIEDWKRILGVKDE